MKEIWRNMMKYEEYMKKYEGIMKDIWMKYEKIWRNMKENMKKYEADKKNYVGNMKIKPLLIYRPWDLEKFWAHPLFSGQGEAGGGSQFPGLEVPQRKYMKHVKS